MFENRWDKEFPLIYNPVILCVTLIGFNYSYSLRHILGEDLGQLNTKDLEQLERQLDSSLRQIRSRRVCSMHFIGH